MPAQKVSSTLAGTQALTSAEEVPRAYSAEEVTRA